MSQVVVDGWTCPLIFCEIKDMHVHESCDGCGALEFMNIGCIDCRNHWSEMNIDDIDNVVVHELFDAFHRAWIKAGERIYDG